MFLLSSEDLMSILSWRYGFAALTKATSRSQSEARERYISVPLRSRDRKLTPKLCLLIGIEKETEMSDVHLTRLLLWNEREKAMIPTLTRSNQRL